MTENPSWIIVKRLNQTLGWNNFDRAWKTVAKATVFVDRNYLLPQGGIWRRKVFNAVDSDVDWNEGDLITTTRWTIPLYNLVRK